MADESIEWQIILKQLNGTINEAESRILNNWLKSSHKHRTYLERVCRAWKDSGDCNESLDIEALIQEFDHYVELHPQKTVESRPYFWGRSRQTPFKSLLRVAAVVAYLGLSIFALYWATQIKSASKEPEVFVQNLWSLEPRGLNAFLILSNGEKIYLDTLSDGICLQEPGVKIKKNGKMLTYVSKTNQTNNARNILYVPDCENYRLVLADGSKMTINSGSQLQFPVGLSSPERRCSLDGEAFFDVANSVTAFIVQTSRAEVTVFGTSFNIRAYESEPCFSAALVSGLVHVRTANEEKELKPGQEAVLSDGQSQLCLRTINTYAKCSWLTETLIVEDEPLPQLTARFSKTFGVSFVYDDPQLKNYHFTGEFDLTEGIETCLSRISQMTELSFHCIEKGITNKYLIQKK